MVITMFNFHMSETFWSSQLKINLCTQAGANATPARPCVGHAAYIDFFGDIEQKLCIFISQIDFRMSSIVPWFAFWNIDSMCRMMLRNHESSTFIIFLMKWLFFTMPLYMYMYIYICTHAYMHIYVCMRVYVCVYVCACPCLCINKVLSQRYEWNIMTSSNETYFALLPLCEGNTSVTGGLPSRRPVARGFDVLFDLRH